jgi:hypothetical protein
MQSHGRQPSDVPLFLHPVCSYILNVFVVVVLTCLTLNYWSVCPLEICVHICIWVVTNIYCNIIARHTSWKQLEESFRKYLRVPVVLVLMGLFMMFCVLLFHLHENPVAVYGIIHLQMLLITWGCTRLVWVRMYVERIQSSRDYEPILTADEEGGTGPSSPRGGLVPLRGSPPPCALADNFYAIPDPPASPRGTGTTADETLSALLGAISAGERAEAFRLAAALREFTGPDGV